MLTRSLFTIMITAIPLSFYAQTLLIENIVSIKGKTIVKETLNQGEKHGEWLLFSYKGDTLIKGFYNNGIKDKKWIYFNEGIKVSDHNYINGELNGTYTGYFFSGERAFIRQYKLGLLDGITTSYYKDGTIRQERFYNNNILDSAKKYDYNGNLIEKGPIINGFMCGEWHYYTQQKDSIALFSIADSIKYKKVDAETLYYDNRLFVEERLAEFPGGNPEMIEYISKKIDKLKRRGNKKNKGKVVVKFNINAIGNTTDIEIAEGINDYIDNEIVTIIKNMPNWQPALQSCVPVKIKFVLPLNLK